MDWQPISTAPLDKTRVDLWVTYKLNTPRRVVDCWYSESEKAWMHFVPAEDGPYPWPVGGVPTHWMKVPDEPKLNEVRTASGQPPAFP